MMREASVEWDVIQRSPVDDFVVPSVNSVVVLKSTRTGVSPALA